VAVSPGVWPLNTLGVSVCCDGGVLDPLCGWRLRCAPAAAADDDDDDDAVVGSGCVVQSYECLECEW
jgi:hypothetical protein